MQKHELGPSDERKRHLTWAEFIRRHKEVLWATDFLTTEVWTQTGLTTFFVLFFLQLHTRKVRTSTPSPSAGCAPSKTNASIR